MRLLIESGEEFHLEARVKDPHSVAALLKLFIRELPEPLIPCNMYEAFLEIPSQTDVPSRVALLRRLTSQLPWEHRALLQRLLSLLVRVNDHSAENSMGVQNICICWAPNVLRADEAARADIMQGIRDAPLVLAAFKELIEHYAEIFPSSPLGGAGSSGGGAVGGSGSSGGVASMSPMSGSPMNSFSGITAQSQSHVAVSPLALFADASASLESQGSPSSSAAESARRKKENRNAKMHVISQGEEPNMPVLMPSITRATSPSPPGRVASPTLQEHLPQNLQPQKLPSLRISLPNEPADLPPPPAQFSACSSVCLSSCSFFTTTRTCISTFVTSHRRR